MPVFAVETSERRSPVVVSRGVLGALADYLPTGYGRIFVVTTEDVWRPHGEKVAAALGPRSHQVLLFGGGEERKRFTEVEALAGRMAAGGADRSSVIIAFGGGIVGDLGGFLAAIFMRGIPVIQVPTTLLAQVDAGIGGKTGVNLEAGKNLMGAFHQPAAVIIDPDVIATLPEREYRAGMYEIIKYGVIGSPRLFRRLVEDSGRVLERDPETLDDIIAESVRIKVEVVSADEREHGLRRILNFGHTFGHALEAETAYARFLHGEAVAFGMRAATHLGHLTAGLSAEDGVEIFDLIDRYGPIPATTGVSAARLVARMQSDKKTIQGSVHFVLPESIGTVKVMGDISERLAIMAAEAALADLGRR